jgi:hypothetical protein
MVATPQITSAGDQPARQRESAGQSSNGSQPQSARSQETQHDTTSINRAQRHETDIG